MDVYEMMEETLTYTYYYGVLRKQFPAHRSGPEEWRTLPCLALVCPHETEYHFIVRETGTDNKAEKEEVVLVPANQPHRLCQPEPGKHSAAHIQYSMLGALDPLTLFNVPYRFTRKQAGSIREAVLDLIKCNLQTGQYLETILERKEAAFRLLRRILAHSALNKEKAILLNRFSRIQAVLDYIDNNLGGQITRDYLAEIASLSPARFNFLFREIMGMPPKQYVQNQRQKKALELLRDENLTIEQIAERLGYCDQFHFSRQFKKILGVNPSAYRAALKKQEWVFMAGATRPG